VRWAVNTALLAATMIVPADAATITVHAPDSDGRVFIDLVGKIERADADTFRARTAAISAAKAKVIVTLVSSGGDASSALQIGSLIRGHAMSTLVPGERTCTSACALIWVAGLSRMVGDAPRIGFHAAFDPKTRRESGAGNAVIGAYLRDLGMGYKAISFMTRKGPASVEWLTPDLAKDLGITWTTLHPQRTITIPRQPKPRLEALPEIAAAWSKSIRSAALPAAAPSVARQPTQPTNRLQAHAPPVQPHGTRVGQRVVLYEGDSANRTDRSFIGSAIWRAETITPSAEQAPALAVRCDVEIPERRLSMTMVIRRNNDQALPPASHTVGIMFNVPADFPFGGINNVLGMLTKQGETTRGTPLNGVAVKVSSNFFLLGLSAAEAEAQRNLELLKGQPWFGIPVVYGNGRHAIVAVEKGASGERAFAEAFKAWENDTESGSDRAVASPAAPVLPAVGGPGNDGVVPPTITDMDYNVFEFPKKHPTGWKALRRSLPSSLKSVPWIYDLERKATTGPVVKVMVRGRVHYGGTTCKPHDCADNVFAFLVAEDGSNVVAVMRATRPVAASPRDYYAPPGTIPRTQVVGQPNAEELAVLNRMSN
jgi:hypothetical protein